uniref:Uncharacterized protein n=1 Tax=Steinernema glaseri TaxID=37863 RepID=A0A1I7YL14_9BILA
MFRYFEAQLTAQKRSCILRDASHLSKTNLVLATALLISDEERQNRKKGQPGNGRFPKVGHHFVQISAICNCRLRGRTRFRLPVVSALGCSSTLSDANLASGKDHLS